MPGEPHLAGPYRRYPAVSHVGAPRKVPYSHTVNRPRTESHPNLAQHLNEGSDVISSAIDSHPREYDEIAIDDGHYIYNNSNSLYRGGLRAPENWSAVESQPNLSKHNGEGSSAFFRDVGKVEIYGGNFEMNHEYGKKSGLQILEEHIVRSARHDSVEKDEAPRCHPETRKTISHEIWSWINDHSSDTRILWLHGPAGAGKTAIAGTLCERLKAEGRLGGDYFFSRNARKDAKPLFPTISHYLATTFPSAREGVERAFAKDRDMLHRTTDIQLQNLIVDPLLGFNGRNAPSIVVVIDGLDECEGDAAQSRIIEQVFSIYRRDAIPNVRFVIASRPEPRIHDKFTSKPICQLLHQVSLDQTPDETNQDIRTYLESGFTSIRDNPSHQNRLSNIALPWPSPSDLDQLVEKASGQFIYASTVLKFVNDHHAMPDERLKLVLSLKSGSSSSPESPKPFADLDRLYKQILSMIPLPNREKAKAILGAVLYVSASTNTYQNEILSITELLLGLEAGESYSALHSLHSLLHIPQSFGAPYRNAMTPEEYKEWLTDSSCAVRFYHKSFPDYLGDQTRSGEFFVDKNTVHTKLAIGCIKILKGMSAKYACSRLYCIAWDYATMRISDHCTASGPLTPELQEALKQLDVYPCFAPMFLSIHGDKIGHKVLENIKKKVARQRFLAELFSRHKSTTNNPLEKDITTAMKLLIDHNLMFSSNFLLKQLQVLNNWFKHSKCPSHLYKELDIILNEIRSTQRHKPRRRE